MRDRQGNVKSTCKPLHTVPEGLEGSTGLRSSPALPHFSLPLQKGEEYQLRTLHTCMPILATKLCKWVLQSMSIPALLKCLCHLVQKFPGVNIFPHVKWCNQLTRPHILCDTTMLSPPPSLMHFLLHPAPPPSSCTSSLTHAQLTHCKQIQFCLLSFVILISSLVSYFIPRLNSSLQNWKSALRIISQRNSSWDGLRGLSLRQGNLAFEKGSHC